jgi:hypothetical protein
MSQCQSCGVDIKGSGLCQLCAVEHGAAEYETYDCPTCDGIAFAEGSPCADCRRPDDEENPVEAMRS